jgi:outer membrane usher protein
VFRVVGGGRRYRRPSIIVASLSGLALFLANGQQEAVPYLPLKPVSNEWTPMTVARLLLGDADIATSHPSLWPSELGTTPAIMAGIFLETIDQVPPESPRLTQDVDQELAATSESTEFTATALSSRAESQTPDSGAPDSGAPESGTPEPEAPLAPDETATPDAVAVPESEDASNSAAVPDAAAVEAEQQPNLNTTGQPISLPVPFKDGNRTLGDITVQINTDSSVSVPKAALTEKMTPLVDTAAQKKLQSIPESGGNVALADIKAAGFAMRFDSGLMELIFEGTAEQRAVTELSLLGDASASHADAATHERPELFSGFINLFGGADHKWRNSESDQKTSLRFDAESVVRFWDVVVENEFGYDGAVDPYLCPAGATCVVDHKSGFKRRGSRIVYDMPDEQLRFQLGDTSTQASGFQSQPDLLGVRIEHSPRTFAPGVSLSPTGRSSFLIERQSEVDVVINGTTVQHLQLRPGTYNLSDLPLQAGANNIQLVITDDAGDRRTLSFTSFSDASLLAEGKMEWSASAGVPSYLLDNDRAYLKNDAIGTVFARYGITNETTGELNFQGDKDVLLAGAGLFTSLPVGFLGLQGAVSRSDIGNGFSASASYDLLNVEGAAYALTSQRESLRFSAEYRSDEFRTPGEFQATASGILLPLYNYSWRFGAAYTIPLNESVTATLSGRYQIGNEDAFQISPLTFSQDRYGVDLTLSAPLTDWMHGSISAGYGNDSLLRSVTPTNSDDADLRIGVRFTIRPDEKTHLDANYDSFQQHASTSGSWYDQKGYERWDTSANTQSYGTSDYAAGGASIGYTGNRGEVRVNHNSGLRTSGRLADADQRSSLRAGTAIAFAGDKVAIGAPIRGNGFAIVAPHKTIDGKTVTVGTREDPRAIADGMGPALVSNVPAYSPASIPIDVEDLPTGYSLGKGVFDINAPYRGGYALEAGSAYSVAAYGTLQDAKNQPISLLTGTATSDADPSKQVAIFTNAAGKFGADGLAPGRWTVVMATEDAPTRFVLDIPDGTDGLFKAGTLTPTGTAAEVATP